MAGPRPRESTFTGLAGGSCGKIDQIDTGYPWQCRITVPGPGRQWAEDREANVGVPKIRFSARGSLDFIEFMKPFWIKSQSIAT